MKTNILYLIKKFISSYRKVGWLGLLLILSISLYLLAVYNPTLATSQKLTSQGGPFLPIIMKEPYNTPTPTATATPVPTPTTEPGQVMLGMIPDTYWQPLVLDAIQKEFMPLETWSGKRFSIAAIFDDFSQYSSINSMLPVLWDHGYTPFVNLYSNKTASQIATGVIDDQIRAWARGVLTFAQGGTRMVYIAPLQEMDGYWVPYGLDPANYKVAYRRIRSIFTQEGVPAESVRWVFASNNHTRAGDPVMEDYYPGDAYVDVVAMSAYNFGFNPLNSFPVWGTYDQIYTPYLQRFAAMAPTKPIFIAQTASTAYDAPNHISVTAKNQWLRDSYTYLANYPAVKAVIYYNGNADYDWQIFNQASSIAFAGYKDAVQNPNFVYIAPGDLKNINLTP
jgi:hypothetical protein